LSARINARGEPARFVSIVGASGSGKTVYLGLLLDVLSHGTRTIKGLANDSFSVAVQSQTVTALQARCFPQKTSSDADSWNWVHCQVSDVRNRKKYLDLITPDFAGEAIALEMENPGAYPAISAVVTKSQAVVMLCDSINVRDCGASEDLFAMKLAAYIHTLRCEVNNPTRRGKIDLPLAIVFTKCDGCPDAADNPKSFAESNMSRLMQYCKNSFSRFRMFAVGVAGSSATIIDRSGRRAQVPIHTEPRGITEPIEWFLNQK